jgi:hypothetical protein
MIADLNPDKQMLQEAMKQCWHLKNILMNLEKFIRELNEVDEDLIIFQKYKLSIDSEIALLNGEGGENGIMIKDGAKYLYLLEVFISTFPYNPNDFLKRLW